MTPLRDALAALLDASLAPPGREELTLTQAAGRILAEDVRAAQAVPPFDNSAMDGYALRVSDAQPGACLPVRGVFPAGGEPGRLEEGCAARIFTGGPLPDGADCVVMQEDCQLQDGRLRVGTAPQPGQYLRRRGEDIAEGSVILRRGRRLRPQDIGLLASVGRARVPVYRHLEVALLVTGDELREPGSGPLSPGQIYDSSGALLWALLQRCGVSVQSPLRVQDSPAEIESALGEAAEKADVILSTGGVSVGEADHVRAAVERLGQLSLWRVAIKPGKPLAFGHVADTPFLGLPGNPASVFVTFALLARPFLMRCQGCREEELPALPVRAAFAAPAGTREEYLRVSLRSTDGVIEALPSGNQSSGALSAVSAAQALAVMAPGREIRPGDTVPVILLDALLY
jgi:molybdopterin molybdotransferase